MCTQGCQETIDHGTQHARTCMWHHTQMPITPTWDDFARRAMGVTW